MDNTVTKFNKVTVIAGAARSGTSWLGQILDSSPKVRFRFQPLFSYAFKGAVNEDSTKEEFERFFHDIYKSHDEFLLQKDKRKAGLYPTFQKQGTQDYLAFKTARYQYILEPILRKLNNVYVIGIVRNPCAVINSWIKIPSEFPTGSDPLKEWRHGMCKNSGPEDFFGYYKWKEVANMYLDLQKQYPKKMTIIRYEDLAQDPLKQTKRLFSFIKLGLEKQTIEFLDESTKKHVDSPYSVYKNKSVMHQWKKELDEYIVKEIHADLAGTRLEQFLK